jgi:hypothetical protein
LEDGVVSPEPVTAAAALIAMGKSDNSDKSTGILKRLLGPVADEIGLEMAEWVRSRHENVESIVNSAERKLGSGIDVPGAIPLRVASKILGEGSYCSDRVMGEYLGGVLASSRTPDGRDDRGARWVSLITSLSSYEIRLHYLLYSSARNLYLTNGTSVNWGYAREWNVAEINVAVRVEDLEACMDFSNTEQPKQVFPEAMFALNSEGLVHMWEIMPNGQFPKKRYNSDAQALITFQPTSWGIQLFMWAHGVGEQWPSFSDPRIELQSIEVEIPRAITYGELMKTPL